MIPNIDPFINTLITTKGVVSSKKQVIHTHFDDAFLQKKDLNTKRKEKNYTQSLHKMINTKAILISILLLSAFNLISQNIGIGSTNPQSKLHLGAGDIYLENSNQGLIVKSPNGQCWKLSVTNEGLGVFSNIDCPGVITVGSITYGGQTYATKLMPDGKWWMAENLNIGTMVTGATNMTNNSILEKYCYNNVAANCTTYGGIYQWNEMMQYTTAQGAQGICPTSWHLPTLVEWTSLENALLSPDKGSRLSGNAALWTNGVLDQSTYFASTGFAAFPGGYRTETGTFLNISTDAYMYSSTENGGSNAHINYIGYNNTTTYSFDYFKTLGASVRCVQN